MRLSQLTYIIFVINAVVDTGKYKVSVNEIRKQIEINNVFPYIKELVKDDLDLSPLTTDVINELNAELLDIELALGSQSGRKFGVENDGLCLIIAWITEIIQRKFK